MARRKPYTRVKKEGQVRPDHVDGMGDVAFKGFQCLNSECTEFIFVRTDEIGEAFEITCPQCGHVLRSGGETTFFDYDLVRLREDDEDETIETGEFVILHDDYVEEAHEYKYCLLCNALKPVVLFDVHRSRKTGRQGECSLCKQVYNSIKNQTRLIDQHREAAQKRRLYVDLSGGGRIDSESVRRRFEHKCFKCGEDLIGGEAGQRGVLDHTLPARYLWPLTKDNATLLCSRCNGNKAEKWPSEFYSRGELRRLSVLTGIEYDLLAGEPQYNPEALEKLQDSEQVDAMLVKYGAYMDELRALRNRVLLDTGVDFFQHATGISEEWVTKADEELAELRARRESVSEEPDTDGQ